MVLVQQEQAPLERKKSSSKISLPELSPVLRHSEFSVCVWHREDREIKSVVKGNISVHSILPAVPRKKNNFQFLKTNSRGHIIQVANSCLNQDIYLFVCLMTIECLFYVKHSRDRVMNRNKC